SLSTQTVSTYKNRILSKMKMGSLADIVKYAIQHGLID
ncbi:MAG: LuxR C-terminal-related transcriptional regulator, partial [Nitrospirota bacterium]